MHILWEINLDKFLEFNLDKVQNVHWEIIETEESVETVSAEENCPYYQI